MALHHFHCSDGVDLLLDRVGRELGDNRDVADAALAFAEALMNRLPNYEEWENWSVYVYDGDGEVGIVPFPVHRSRLAA